MSETNMKQWPIYACSVCISQSTPEIWQGPTGFSIECRRCHSKTYHFGDINQAVKTWNECQMSSYQEGEQFMRGRAPVDHHNYRRVNG